MASSKSEIKIEVQVDPKKLMAIGRVVSNWAYLEQRIDLWLGVLLAQPGTENLPKDLKLAFKRRLRLWRDVAKICHPEPDKASRIDVIIDRVAKARDDRDWVVHGLWSVHGDIHLLKVGQKVKIQKRVLTLRQVEKVAAEIAALIWDHSEFYQRYSIKLGTGADIPYDDKSA